MNRLVAAGKSIVGLFWLGELLNLFQVWPETIAGVYHLLAATILAVHVLEVVLASRVWAGQWVEPKFEKMQILVFGVFHILALRERERPRN